MGLVIDGKVCRGEVGLAGEIGHTVIQKGGVKCICGRRGCLGQYVSSTAIINRVKNDIHTGKIKGKEYLQEPLSIEKMIEATKEGDEYLTAIFRESAEYLGIAIVNIINLLNPRKIIIEGIFNEVENLVRPVIDKIISQSLLNDQSGATEIVFSHMGEYNGAVGAAILARERYFSQFLKKVYFTKQPDQELEAHSAAI